MISFLLDLSGQKWASAAVEHLRDARISQARFEAANRELEAFSYSVAHDLRAPLRAISGFARLLGSGYRDRLDAAGCDWLDEIDRNGVHMGELIDALLALSRVSRGDLVVERVDLAALAHDAIRRLSAAEPGRTVELVAPPSVPVDMDRRLAAIVVDNLVGNAWKFTRNTPAARIELAARDGRYSISDNGAGFDPAYAAKLFVPFQRLHSAREFPGTGIGLATVQRVIHRHGGRIWADGRPGGGATFSFTLSTEPDIS